MKRRLKDLQIMEWNFLNISFFLSTFNIELLYFVFTFDSETTIISRGLFIFYLAKESLYIDLFFIKFCIFDKSGRDYFIK